MSYDLYRYIFIGGLVLSIVMLMATLVIFFLLDIRKVIGDLTGSNARRGIENIQNQGLAERSKEKRKTEAKRPAYPNHENVSDSLKETSKLSPQDRYNSMEAGETALLSNVQEEAVPAECCYQMEWKPANPNFVIVTDITYVHSGEIIK